MGEKHIWTFEENQYCCEKYVEYFVIRKSNISASEFVRLISPKLYNISPNSVRRKVQNIKQILEEKGISNSLRIASSTNYSKDNLSALESVLVRYNITSDK